MPGFASSKCWSPQPDLSTIGCGSCRCERFLGDSNIRGSLFRDWRDLAITSTLGRNYQFAIAELAIVQNDGRHLVVQVQAPQCWFRLCRNFGLPEDRSAAPSRPRTGSLESRTACYRIKKPVFKKAYPFSHSRNDCSAHKLVLSNTS